MLNTNEILEKLKANNGYFDYVRKELKNDKDFCLLALQVNPYFYLYNSFKCKTDMDVIKFIVNTGNIELINGIRFDENLINTNEEYKKLYQDCLLLKSKIRYLRLYSAIWGEKKIFEDFKGVNRISPDFIMAMSTVLKTLSPREEEVIKDHFGLFGTSPKTLDELGEKYHITRERARMIETKALMKLRHPSRSNLAIFAAAKMGIPSAVDWVKQYADNLKPINEVDGKTPLENVDFSVRTKAILMRAGYQTLEEVLMLPDEALMKIRNLGKKGFDEIKSKKYLVEENNYTLKPEEETNNMKK